MLGALERHLRNHHYPASIINGEEFLNSRKILDGKVCSLREKGKGKKPNNARPLTHDDEEVFWRHGQLGAKNPRSLLNTIWYFITIQFGLRGREDHHNLQVSEFKMETDEKGRAYVEFEQGPSETNQGGLNFREKTIRPRMYATGGERCPVKLFQLFLSKRPFFKRSSGPLYLAPIDSPQDKNVWYKNIQVGVNTINNIVKTMVGKTPLSENGKKYTNHSVRKTCVKKLRAAGFAKCEIINITGHRHEAGLDPYDEGNSDELQSMSAALANDVSTTAIQPLPCISAGKESTSSTSTSAISSLAPTVPQATAPISNLQFNQLQIAPNRMLQNPNTRAAGNFSFGIPWTDDDRIATSNVYHGQVYMLNNCSNVTLNNGEALPARRRIRVIVDSDEEN